ncbi:MAG: NAD(P)-dependent oxidoreductase [Pelagibacteraceae bacterium TMED124]|nr:hypothetical protein [Candidatus Neomarinimicrobiota bacterium]RPG17208.1 MAG: NAD(P)-dependent oxidoreductase [Pelagibacteraceae bacterium TMED124]
MKNYIIVGGYSQDAIYITKYILKNRNSKIYLLVDKIKSKHFINKNVRYLSFDIFNYNKIKIFLRKFKTCKIIFLASKNISSDQKEESNILFQNIDINVKSLILFLEYISNFNKNIKLFYASSSHIFYNTKKKIQSEKTNPNFLSNYALSKYLGFEICNYYRDKKKINVSTGIIYTHYSKYTKSKFLIKKILYFMNNTNKKKLSINNPSKLIDFLHASEVADAIIQILKLKKPNNFIISSYQPIKINKIFTILKRILNKENKQLNKKKIKNNSNKTLIGNNKKILKQTGWKPLTTMERIKLLVDDE